MDEKGRYLGDRATRCLIVVPRGFDAPLDLLHELHRRNVMIREVNDAPSAMVALARDAISISVLVEPDILRDAGALVRAMRTHHALVVLWQYRRDAQPRLDRMEVNEASSTQASATPAPPQPRTPIQARQEAQEQPAADPHPAPPPEADQSRPLDAAGDFGPAALSDEELAMLLGDDPPYEDGRNRDAPRNTD